MTHGLACLCRSFYEIDRLRKRPPGPDAAFEQNPLVADRPTSGESRLSILLLVVAAHQRVGRLVERELAADGVDARDYALLSLVGVRAPVRLTEAAAELGMRLTTASDAVRRLEARGHVARIPNPADGRSWLFELSSEGDEEWRRGWPALRRIQASLEGLLGDHATVRSALVELGDALERALTKA